jgi:hypothetical protein
MASAGTGPPYGGLLAGGLGSERAVQAANLRSAGRALFGQYQRTQLARLQVTGGSESLDTLRGPSPPCLKAPRNPCARAGHVAAPRRWADTLALELAAAAHRHPLLSGFYRMLAATTRTAVRAGVLHEAAPAGEAAAGPVCQQVGGPCSALTASGRPGAWLLLND